MYISACGLWSQGAVLLLCELRTNPLTSPSLFPRLFNEGNLHELVATRKFKHGGTQLLLGVAARTCNLRTPEVKA